MIFSHQHRGMAALLLWTMALLSVLEAFYYWDWEYGLVRFFLLFLLGTLVFVMMAKFRRQPPVIPPKPVVNNFFLFLLLFAGGLNALTGLRSFERISPSGELEGDQPRNLLRAIHLLVHGVNPYGERIMLDPVDYESFLTDLKRSPLCGVAPDFFENGKVDEYYVSPSLETAAPLYPKIHDLPSCRFFKKAFRSLGFRYGPMLLLVHGPAVLLLGGEGILIDHFIFFACLLGILIKWFNQESHSFSMSDLPLLMFLFTIHLRWNSFVQGHLDILPVLFTMSFLWATAKNKNRWAAIFLGLSASSKIFPALLYTPLLFRKPREILFFCLPVFLLHLPFLLWNPQGLWNNLTFQIFVYPADSTSLRYYLPIWIGPFFIAGLLLIAGAGLRWVRKTEWSMKAMIGYAFFLHLAAYAAARSFHNNHLVWILPLLSVLFFYSIRPEKKLTKDLLS